MAWMVEARDPYTGGHLWRVSQFSQLLASQAGLAEKDVSRISVGAFLHDLGKISVPDHILSKKDKLTDEEYAVIKTHPDVGWRMLSSHPLAKLAEEAIRAHHETPDGKGYPRGLDAARISIDARIVGICDAFDAMTSTRPYRKGMPVEKALAIIEENLDRQFDRKLGELFVAIGRKGALDHIVGHSDLGIPLQDCVMCGPTIAVKRSHAMGTHLYCPSCTAEYSVARPHGKFEITPTGKTGSPAELAPQVDSDVIFDVVRASARALLV
jgi:HD superfamily phosphodiesterase